MSFNLPTANTASNVTTSNQQNTQNTQQADPNSQNVGVDPNSPPTRNSNPHQNSGVDKETNALSGLASLLSMNNNQNGSGKQQNGNPNFDHNAARRPSNNVDGAQHQDNRNPAGDQQQGAGDTRPTTQRAIEQMLHTYKGDALYEYDADKMRDTLVQGDFSELQNQMNAAIQAGINRTLEVVLDQIAPMLIEASVTQSVSRASDTISTNNVWNEFAEAYPQMAQAEQLVRPHLEMAYRNTGDKKKAIESIMAVYGHAAGVGQNQNTASRDIFAESQPFDPEKFFGS